MREPLPRVACDGQEEKEVHPRIERGKTSVPKGAREGNLSHLSEEKEEDGEDGHKD